MTKQMNADIFECPQPTGNYAVGTKSIHLIDQQRKETYCPDTNKARELMVTAWYPTDAVHGTLSPYAPDYLIDGMKGFFKPFKEVTQDDTAQLDAIRVHAAPDAPIIDHKEKLPLVIFSHGYYGSRFYCSALCQELASHGYVVLAIDHTYDCGITQFPDGRIITWKSLTGAAYNSDEFYAAFATRLEVRVADIKYVIDAVENNTNPLFDHIEANKIGLLGCSFGGEAVLQACAHDRRIQAVAALDAFPIGNLLPDSFNTPCMLFEAERTDWCKLECSDIIKEHMAKQVETYHKLCDYKIVLKGADHVVFSDFALFSHMPLFKKLPEGNMFAIGSIDGFRATEIMCMYLVAFFDKALKGKASQFLDNNVNDNDYQSIVK